MKTLRTFSSLLLLSLLLVAGCGGGGGPCGAAGQGCCNWPSPSCGNGLVCNGSTCQSCGASAGSRCCSFYTCNNPGLTCDSTPSSTWSCTACGHSGQPCCYNQRCVDGTACNAGSNVCGVSAARTCSGAAVAGAMWFQVRLRNPDTHCGLIVLPEFANSQGEADGCGQSDSAAMGMRGEAVSSGSLDYHDYASIGPTGLCTSGQYPAFSTDDAAYCAQYNCLNCTIRPGGC